MKAILGAIALQAVLPIQAMSQEAKFGDGFVQGRFAEAYNRKDVDAMAAAFSANAIRVTPSGIFNGRDEIRKSFRDAINLGMREYSVKQTGSRAYGDLFFNVGEWTAKLGEQPFHGYYTAIIGHEGDQPKILEETVTVSVK